MSLSPLRRLADGTVKQVGPLTGTRVWTVPGRGNRPLAGARGPAHVLEPGEHTRLCAFCQDRYLETTPEKTRLVGGSFARVDRVPASALHDSVAEFRRFGNLFEIVSAEYWRTNHDFHPTADIVAWADDYLADPAGRAHIQQLAAIRAASADAEIDLRAATVDLVGGSHDVIVARRHVRDDAVHDDDLVSSGVLTPDEHAVYMTFTVEAMREIAAAQPYAAYVSVFQNWLRPAGASFEHLHKQIVAIDEYGPQTERELALLEADPRLYQHAVADLSVRERLLVAANDGSVAFAGIGHRYPAFEVYSRSAAHHPAEHSPTEVRAVSDLVHALHAATGALVPTNEEWHYRPAPAAAPMPWRIVLKWRVSNPAGFEGGTKVYVNTIDPWSLRHRVVDELTRLRAEGRIADGIRIGDECTPGDARLHYAD
jgi:galactose-1-phosphate uridylyltransferase